MHRSPAAESQHSRSSQLGYVKVVDPLKQGLANLERDPKDRSDSKLGPTTFGNSLRRVAPPAQNVVPLAAAAAPQSQNYQKSTHRANSSVHSREELQNQAFTTPEVKQMSIKLQD